MSSASDLIHLIFIVAMLLILSGGMVSVLVLWYVRGRDPHAGPIAAYISEPPDDLPPGAAGVLLDEHVEERDVTATLLGLARHGAVEITEIEEAGRRDFNLILLHPERIESRLERDLLKALFGPRPQALQEVRLSRVGGAFRRAKSRIHHDLYQEMVDRNYFTRAPDSTRRFWRVLSWTGIIASIVVGVGFTILTDAWALFPTVAAVMLWTVMLWVGRRMPQKTRHGAEAAAKWRAFRTYLADIQKYESLETATDLFDRYLAYAVAFGLAKEWLKEFERAGAPVPRWYHSAGEILVLPEAGEAIWDAMEIGRMAGGMGNVGNLGDVNVPDLGGMPNVDLPSVGGGLQGASDLLAGGLQGASDGLFDLFDNAGSIFDVFDR